MKKKILKRATALLSAVAMVFGCAGCGSNDTAGKTEVNDGTLKVAVQSLPATLDCNASVSNAGIQVYYNIYDTLIMRDTSSDEISYLPGLAVSWEQIDELTWEFKLRENVKFHDGTVLDAEDVCYSMNRVINEETADYATAHSYLLSNFVKFEAVDNLTVRAYTTNPEPLIENLLSDPNVGITSKEYVESVGLDAAALAPVSTAPYKVTTFSPNEKVVLEKFNDYWGDEAPFEKIEITCVSEIVSRITALQNGEVDMITNIPPDQESLVSANTNVYLVGGVYSMYHIVRFNMSNEATNDAKLRAALDYAIDREALVESIWGGKAEAATTYQFEQCGDLYIEEREGEITYDLEKAKELLAASDYNGEVIQIYNQTDYYTYMDLALQAIIDMWKEIGVNAELVEAEDLSTFDKADMHLKTWSNPLYYVDPMGVLDRHWMPGGEANKCGHFVTTDEYVEQYKIARYSTSLEDRIDALNYIYDYFRSETPFLYLYKPYESIAVSNTISYEIPSNVRSYTLGFRAGEISVNE